MENLRTISPDDINRIAWECPDCHCLLVVHRPEGDAELVSADCPTCAGTRRPGTRIRQHRIDLRQAFVDLADLADRNIRLVLPGEEE